MFKQALAPNSTLLTDAEIAEIQREIDRENVTGVARAAQSRVGTLPYSGEQVQAALSG